MCWGANNYGEASPPSGQLKQVSAGQGFTCGLRLNSTLACWGNNAYNQASPPGDQFTQVSVAWLACGLKSDGSVKCWDQYWTMEWESEYAVHMPLAGKQVSAGSQHVCVLQYNDTVICGGDGDEGQRKVPEALFKQVSAGWRHNCALRTDGAVLCWGDNTYGQSTPPSGLHL